MGKIMGKPKNKYNAFPELRTKFFQKQCVTLSFPPSFNEFHDNFQIFKFSGTINDEEIVTTTSGTVMHAKFELMSMQNAKVLNKGRI